MEHVWLLEDRWTLLDQHDAQVQMKKFIFKWLMMMIIMILFYCRVCPSTAGSSQSSNFLCPLLSLSILLPVAPQCHLSNDVLVFRLILHPLPATLASNSPSIIFHSDDVSSLFPFHIGYILDCIYHSGSLPNDGVTDVDAEYEK